LQSFRHKLRLWKIQINSRPTVFEVFKNLLLEKMYIVNYPPASSFTYFHIYNLYVYMWCANLYRDSQFMTLSFLLLLCTVSHPEMQSVAVGSFVCTWNLVLVYTYIGILFWLVGIKQWSWYFSKRQRERKVNWRVRFQRKL
jgi:hypothetical protein